ncbi:TPA: YSIRK-type signal peptide-containing protein [Streptococcus pneumoniae]|nr:YSIRK-type signal peptide-containing protein [Streptococcus pneumoniae]HEV8902016.1 YSIRK-type signal peptide-containing protein [Streptococcus pneumoniae]HEV8907892.1 YSIRK-type signal peptide-containing protein [Streptococcus pneumoniae]HEX1985393.1 YSIRK-type signal peptide-containing protein [Streptococcus pneumoniae]
MKKSYRDDNGEKVFRYSIRKYHFGAASVAVAALMFFANGAVAASETITPTTASDIVKAGSDGNADGNPASSDEGDSKQALTDKPAELKAADELKTQEAPAEGANQTSSTGILQPRILKNSQSDYDPIPIEDDEDDVRDGLFSSENPVTTIQPRSSHSVTGRGPQVDTTVPKVSLGNTVLPTSEKEANTSLYRIRQGQAFTPKLKVWDNSGSIKNLDITGIPNGVTKQKFGNDFAEQTAATEMNPYSGSTFSGNVADTQAVGQHTAQITVKDASNNEATYYLKYEVYPARVEAKQNRFGQVKDKALIHGDNPANYIKFKNANNQEVQKPAGVEVTWERKPSTAVAGLDKTGVVKVTYHVTDENGAVRDEVQTVTINTPVYHATLIQNPFTTTYGREFVNKNQPRDGRRYISYNGRNHFNLSNLRVYWENSNIRGEKFSDGTRPWSTNYLGKKHEKLMVRYPGDNGRYDNRNDDYGERYEELDGTFIVKPVKPSIQTSLGKVGKNTLTVNNVNSGTTVVIYDAANPNNLKELGRTTVAKVGDYSIKNGVEVPLNSGVTFKKDQKIVAKVIYEITNRDQRTDSDVSDTWTVKESLIANGIHIIKGESYTGTAKDRIRYNDNVDADHRTALPNNATASWAQNPNYTTLGTTNYTANVTIPGQGSATVDVPVHVYAPASLKANSYNNKQGTLSNGDNPENYI